MNSLILKLALCVLIFPAASASPPYSPSPVIEKIVWAPADTIVRRATGSDNLPVTWADDDAIYITWGDGWGFEPKAPKKLSMGFACVIGEPSNFKGINVRSAAEQYGGGRSGRKGWGLISVNGVLYLLGWTRRSTRRPSSIGLVCRPCSYMDLCGLEVSSIRPDGFHQLRQG